MLQYDAELRMRYRDRPSPKEIDKRLKDAKAALIAGRGYFASFDKCFDELNALDIGDVNEIWGLILELIEEIALEHYAGSKPPLKSYEPTIENCELFAFSWYSESLKKEMYLKFVVKEDCFYYVSLHVDKKTESGHEMCELQQRRVQKREKALLAGS